MSKSKIKSLAALGLVFAVVLSLTSCKKKEEFSFGYIENGEYINKYLGIGIFVGNNDQCMDHEALNHDDEGQPWNWTYDFSISYENDDSIAIMYYNLSDDEIDMTIDEYADELASADGDIFDSKVVDRSKNKIEYLGYDAYEINLLYHSEKSDMYVKYVTFKKDSRFVVIDCVSFDSDNTSEILNKIYKLK